MVLFSPGGYVVEALALGDYIRRRGLATVVLDEHLCASSCPMVFASGVKRIASDKAWIGVHQIYIGDSLKPGTDVHREIADIQDLTAKVPVTSIVWFLPECSLYPSSPYEVRFPERDLPWHR